MKRIIFVSTRGVHQMLRPAWLTLLLVVALVHPMLLPAHPVAAATQIDLMGPEGSGAFGASVTILRTGNIVVTDPAFDLPDASDVGAVYLYAGTTGALISTLTGSSAGDRVGENGVAVLSNGNFVIISTHWNNGAISNAGAVTWGNGISGVSGVVSPANSLVGSSPDDQVGEHGVVALSNGNYVVSSILWDNGAISNAGAVTWGNGATGVTGAVSPANSLVGSTADDLVGEHGVVALSNGNYVASSMLWDNGAISNAGAATWGNGTSGVSGPVSPANSLVGSTPNDTVGAAVTVLSNANYVVSSPNWDNGAIGNAGAATWVNGATGSSGPVSPANSLVGSSPNDFVSAGWVTALSNGNYVVVSSSWDNGAIRDAGAATWGDGTSGSSGAISPANSLVGSSPDDHVSAAVTALSNGNYVVSSPNWANGPISNAGAATWGNGATGSSGAVSPANSLVGSNPDDYVGFPVALRNGNYVVVSSNWDNGALGDAGAATWGHGATGISGVVSAANSLVGGDADIHVGQRGVTALLNGNYVVVSAYLAEEGAVTWGDGTSGVTGVVSSTNSLVGTFAGDGQGQSVTALGNGNYVVSSPNWANGQIEAAGAVTWGNGSTGVSGFISPANSLVGDSFPDQVGRGGVLALSNGNYVVGSPNWVNGNIDSAGAVTWGDGMQGSIGVVSPANSLVGSNPFDYVGEWLTPLSNGSYLVLSPSWKNGDISRAGAFTLADGNLGTTVGPITAANSIVGTVEDGGSSFTFDHDAFKRLVVVGRAKENLVTILQLTAEEANLSTFYLPMVKTE